MSIVLSQEYIIDKNTIRVSRESILKAMDVPLHAIDDYLNGLIGHLTETCLEISTPRSAFVVYNNPDLNGNDALGLNNESFRIGRMIHAALRGSSHIAIFIGTAGERVEQLSKQYQSTKCGLEGLVVDIIGSEIAECVAAHTHRAIENESEGLGLRITNRFSPGYCGWSVEDQKPLFKLLNGWNQGVKLNSSSLMTPIKSVTGIVGMGTNVQHRDYQCSKCSENHCLYRTSSKGKKAE